MSVSTEYIYSELMPNITVCSYMTLTEIQIMIKFGDGSIFQDEFIM
jgi:hypothetical protein